MISLMLSSSKSGSIGRRNGRINSKLIAGISQRWKPGVSRASESEEEAAYAATSSGVNSSSCSSGLAFSARSSLRIESTRISQMVCSEFVFLLSYFRLRSSPSTWR